MVKSPKAELLTTDRRATARHCSPKPGVQRPGIVARQTGDLRSFRQHADRRHGQPGRAPSPGRTK